MAYLFHFTIFFEPSAHYIHFDFCTLKGEFMEVLHFSTIDRPKQASSEATHICINRHYDAVSPVPLHTHDFYEIAYVYDGEGIQIINKTSYVVKKGSVIIMQPGDYHTYHSLNGMSLFQCMFLKQLQTFKSVPIQITFPSIVQLDSYFQLQIEQLFYLLEEELVNQKPFFHIVANNFLADILLLIARNTDNLSSNSQWNEVLNYISENLRDVNFQKAVKIFGASESYFCRAFKKEFSVTFKQYVKSLRIQYAKELCQSTKMSISEIYEECGYTNNRSFFTDFMKAVNMTPLQYRKKYAINSSNTSSSTRVQS